MKKICKQCGKEFELSESEISFYKSKGLELPKRCKSCRNKNKGQSNSNRNSSQAKQEQKNVSISQSSQKNQQNYNRDDNNRNDYNRCNHNRNNHNRNDKSYVVISAAAVLLVLLVFVLKSVFAAPSESIPVGEDVVSSNIPIKQETPEEAFSEKTTETLEDAQSTLQQPQKEDEEQPKEQTQEQTDVQTQSETQNAAPAETEIVAAVTTAEAVPETPNVAYGFRKAEYLTEHFQKHGAEFPYATEEEYLLGANNVIQNPSALHKLEAEDGDDVYYVENTREFVVVSTDGYIRTYFLADLDYFNRQ